MSRMIIPFNKNWKYSEDFKPSYILPDFEDKKFQEIDLLNITDRVVHDYTFKNEKTNICCYRNGINISEQYKNKCIFIDFHGILPRAEIYLNGELLESYNGEYMPFSIELTNKLKFDKSNILVVKIDFRERNNLKQLQNRTVYSQDVGIYGKVDLRILNKVFIEEVVVNANQDVINNKSKLDGIVLVDNVTNEEQEAEIELVLRNGEDVIGRNSKIINIDKKRKSKIEIEIEHIRNTKLVDMKRPKLYTIEASLIAKNNMVDFVEKNYQLLEPHIIEEGFYLNL